MENLKVSLLFLFLINCSCDGVIQEDQGFFSKNSKTFEQSGCERITIDKELKQVKVSIQSAEEVEICTREAIEFWNREVEGLNLVFTGYYDFDKIEDYNFIAVRQENEIPNKEDDFFTRYLGSMFSYPTLDCVFKYISIVVVSQDINSMCDTMKHEVGHALGLDHDTIEGSIMTQQRYRECENDECFITNKDLLLLNNYFKQ